MPHPRRAALLSWFLTCALALSGRPASPWPAILPPQALSAAAGAYSPAELKQLIARVAAGERDFRAARDHYTYRQTFEFVEEGGGMYRAVTDVTFTPEGKRLEKPLRKPINTLKRIQLTEEDFRDLAGIQPFVLEPEDLWNYEVAYVDEQLLRGMPTLVLRISPRQTFEGQRLFDGFIWVSKEELQVVQVEGQAVPNIIHNGKENLFPRFTTIRAKIDGKHWFPVETRSDDQLQFRTGPVRVHFSIKYENYKRFQAESRIQYQTK
jgi:hypothetical protein